MHFQSLLAYEAVKGCFTDDQLLLQSKEEKVKMEPKESYNIYMQRLEGADTQWYAIFTLQMCILAVLWILKEKNSFPAGTFCISILVAVYMGLPINVEKYNTGIIHNWVDLSADQQEFTCHFVFLFYIYN